MKLKEKLAAQTATTHWNNRADLNFRDPIAFSMGGYIAGFEKAREMATQIAKDYGHPTLCPEHYLCGECQSVYGIRTLGEEEVEK